MQIQYRMTSQPTQTEAEFTTLSDTSKPWHHVLRIACILLSTVTLGALAACGGERATYSIERAPTTTGGPQPSPEAVARAVTGPGAVERNAQVVAISDGDTITVSFSGAGRDKVRLIGIDTPETNRPNTPVQCFGPEATQFMTALLPVGTEVRIERDVEERDRFGRLLGYVYRARDGLFINAAIARYGYAGLLTYPPNVAHVDIFTDAVQAAREEQRGLWRACPTTVGS